MKLYAYKFIFLFSLISLILSGCAKKAISIFTDYVTEENLASFHVGTPDPALNCPPFGQRLFLSWNLKHLPKPYQIYSDLSIKLTIRFKNREEIVEDIKLLKSSGTYMFSLMNEEYCSKIGIATYKAILYGDGCPLEEWRHQLWAELITVDVPEGDAEANDDDFNEIGYEIDEFNLSD